MVKGNKLIQVDKKAEALKKKREQAEKLRKQKEQMEIDDKLKRESELLKSLIQADEEQSKETNNDYFKKTSSKGGETAFDDMKNGDSLTDVSSLILKKAKKSFL